MAYAALLFCPEEKTARTVTQVLAELEFRVEPCTEPFAAVKKLMSQHFDAIVVDCDNEQNATLLFKSARNSTSNQTSLAVAIVEGQAGVAKAFRIGANLVLTKPINVEQSKGTLRVARGLLRKGEPGKPTASPAPVPAPTATPARPSATKATPAAPTLTGMSQSATRPAANSPAHPTIPPAIAKIPSSPEAQTAASAVSSFAAATVGKNEAASVTSAASPVPSKPLLLSSSSGAAAPAPAREPEVGEGAPAIEPKASMAEAIEPAPSKAEPSDAIFTFGGANAAEPTSSPGKKIVFGLIAAIVIAAAAYAGWTYFQGHHSVTDANSPAVPTSTKPVPASQPATRSQGESPASRQSTTTIDESHASATRTEDEFSDERIDKSDHSGKASSRLSPATASSTDATLSKETSSSDVEEAAPLVVKSGSESHHHAAHAASDVPAPSMIGMAAPAAEPPIAGIVADQPIAKPVLQSMKVSQGVAQGLIIKRVAPDYPRSALMMHIEGAVDLAATISKDGEIKDVKVLKGDSQLSRAAVQAVKQWKYKPYLLNGEPVEIQTQITVDFKLPQ